MHSTSKQEDVTSFTEASFLGWQHLPYRSLFANDLDAATSYLGQFHEIKQSKYNPSGALYVCTGPDLFVGVRYLSSETNNFGIHCARLEPGVFKHPEEFSREEIERAARFLRGVMSSLEGPDHLSSPVESSDVFGQQVLQICGFRLADTILGYHLSLADLPPSQPDAAIRTAQRADLERLSQITSLCFSKHHLNINRFNTESAFDNETVGKTYASWVGRAMLEGDIDLVLVYDDGDVSGFMTFRLPPRHETKFGLSIGRAVLSAVDPSKHGNGIYRKLLVAGCRWLHERDVKFIEGKTQLSNQPAIRVWQSLGSRLALAYHTFHWSSNSIAGLNRLEADITGHEEDGSTR
jgi:ribosomal protein S18 acetylase RimI-like enzyme